VPDNTLVGEHIAAFYAEPVAIVTTIEPLKLAKFVQLFITLILPLAPLG
jgi:hypothetical protein